MYAIEKYRPIALDDLIRLGDKQDGGYVISKRQIEQTETLISLGISGDWSFDTDFTKIKDVYLYAYHYSISLELFRKYQKSSFLYLTCVFGSI